MSDPDPLASDVWAMLDRSAMRRRPVDATLHAVTAVMPGADDQLVAGMAAALRKLCARIEHGILTFAGLPPIAGDPIVDAIAHICLSDTDLVDELSGQVRLARIADALPFDPGADAGGASLLARLVQSRNALVASAAAILLVTENRHTGGEIIRPTIIEARVVWQVAAAVRARISDPAPAIDRRIVDATRRLIDERAGLATSAAAAMHVVAMIDARPDELPTLLEQSLSDRRMALFTALIARALDSDFATVRGLVIAPADARLWLMLRALDLPRRVIARLGFALNEADPDGDVDAFADTIDTLMRVPVEVAAIAVAPILIDPAYRAARAGATL